MIIVSKIDKCIEVVQHGYDICLFITDVCLCQYEFKKSCVSVSCNHFRPTLPPLEPVV